MSAEFGSNGVQGLVVPQCSTMEVGSFVDRVCFIDLFADAGKGDNAIKSLVQ